MTYDTAQIRQFLMDKFSDRELNDFCFDYFPDVYNVVEGMDKSDKVRYLLDYCRKHGRFPTLITILIKLRPAYKETFSLPRQPEAIKPNESSAKTPETPLRNTNLPTPVNQLQAIPIYVWGMVGVLIIVVVWAANNLGREEPQLTPTVEVAANTPTSAQEPLLSATPTRPLIATTTPNNTPSPSAAPEPTPTLDASVPPPNPVQGQTWTRSKDGMVMIYVPAGTFQMGSTEAEVDAAFADCQQTYGDCRRSRYEDEIPQHPVTLDGFWVDHDEVTNAQYQMCVRAGVCTASAYADDINYNSDNFPVVGVSWNDANGYCQWSGGALPTEAQWEYAARGPENRIYPWGDTFDSSLLNFCDVNCIFDWKDETVNDGYTLTSPVGSYPEGASWVGAFDMAGNVWEWVQDWYNESYYSVSPTKNPSGPAEIGSTDKVLRGSSWNGDQSGLRVVRRGSANPGIRSFDFGIRCILLSES